MRDEDGRFIPGRFVDEMRDQLPVNYLITPIAEKGGDVIWKYDEKTGIFKPEGNPWIESKVFDVMGETTTPGMLSAVVKLAQVKTYDLENIFTEEPGFITLKNGVFDIEKRELREFSPDFFSKNAFPVYYDPEAKPVKILKFIKEIVPEDVELIQEWFGYHLLKDQRFRKAFLFVGAGANGKSTLVDLCAKWLGEENVSNVSMYELTSDRFAVADLYGKLANHAPDLSVDEIKRTGRFKAITGQDKVRAQKKGQNAFSFYIYAKPTYMTNQVPITPDLSPAFFSRWEIVEFLHVFEGKKQDPDLLKKLTTEEELSGLFNWALEGLYRLLKNGKFTKQLSVEQTRRKYEFLADPVTAFIEHCTTEDYDDVISKDKLNFLYRAYCRHNGKVPLPKNKFGGQIKNILLHIGEPRPTIDGKRVTCWSGIAVLCGSKDKCQGCQGCQGTLYPLHPSPQLKLKLGGYNPANPANHDGLSSPEVPDDENELEDDLPEALERRALIIEEARRILRELGGETMQKTLFDKLAFRDSPWEEAGPILRADPQFRFMGMMVALKDLPQEEAS